MLAYLLKLYKVQIMELRESVDEAEGAQALNQIQAQVCTYQLNVSTKNYLSYSHTTFRTPISGSYGILHYMSYVELLIL